jgi:hypothetical protein
MYITKKIINPHDPKYDQYRTEEVLRHGSHNAAPDYLWQLDTRGKVVVLVNSGIQIAHFSDSRKSRIPMTVPRGVITNRFQMETFVFVDDKKYVLTLFLKKEHLTIILENTGGYPEINIVSLLEGKSVEWQWSRKGDVLRALVVSRVIFEFEGDEDE